MDAYHANGTSQQVRTKPAEPRRCIKQRSQSSYDNSSAHSPLARPDEDWTQIGDLGERRRIQNRIAQRNYRKKQRKRLEILEERARADSGSASPEPELRRRPAIARPPFGTLPATSSPQMPAARHHDQGQQPLPSRSVATSYDYLQIPDDSYMSRSGSMSSWTDTTGPTAGSHTQSPALSYNFPSPQLSGGMEHPAYAPRSSDGPSYNICMPPPPDASMKFYGEQYSGHNYGYGAHHEPQSGYILPSPQIAYQESDPEFMMPDFSDGSSMSDLDMSDDSNNFDERWSPSQNIDLNYPPPFHMTTLAQNDFLCT